MSAIKSYSIVEQKGPSILALLVDNISRMSASEQKLLWMQLNKKKLTTLAKQLDNTVAAHHLSTPDIDQLISEAMNDKKKKG